MCNSVSPKRQPPHIRGIVSVEELESELERARRLVGSTRYLGSTPRVVGRVLSLEVRDLPAALASRDLQLVLPRGSVGPCDWPAGVYQEPGPDLPRIRSWLTERHELVDPSHEVRCNNRGRTPGRPWGDS